jgi:CRISPR-associated protein Cmr6
MINQTEIRQKLSTSEWGTMGTHAGLWLDKYIMEQSRNDTDSRSNLIMEVAELPEPVEYKAYFERWREMLDSYRAQTRRVRVKGRMIVGMGSEGVLETSISLHRTYGVPYIPGSALKGLAASYAHHYLGDEWRRGGKLHTIVFGHTDDAGYITFFDALFFPGTGQHNSKALAPDIITVHHQKYYQDVNAVPSESDNPNPVPFLTATGTYLFALAAPDFQQPTRWVDITFQILAEALEKLGIGAKTSSGYGRMKFIDPPIKPLDPEMRIAEGYKRELDALKDVAGQVPGYYQKWRYLVSQEARHLLARAIIEKVRQAGREKVTAEKAWYKELQTYLAEIESEE